MPSPEQIANTLRKASHTYYNTGKTIMTDKEFDKLRDYLKKVDPGNDFFTEVGAPVGHRGEVDLIGFMGSQLKLNTTEEVRGWFDKYNQPELIVSDKMDGSSMEAVYQDGELIRVVTRGNGKRGLSITKNAKYWDGLPHSVKAKGQLIVRGEAQLSITNWKINYPEMANPRNAGNGIVVCDNGSERNKHITFHAFDIIHPDGCEFKKQSHKFMTLKTLGFNVVRWFRCKTWDDLLKCREHYESDRPILNFEIDGMILAIEDLEVQKKAGFADGGARPKGQRAYKFDAETAETEVIDIELTIGQTAKVIPTAVLKPVQLAGTTVQHILLNNFDYIKELGLNIGDIVEIKKAGDIIPFCNKVVIKGPNSGSFLPPTDWKGYPLVKDGRDWKVIDDNCPDLNFARMKQWINKLNIKHLGDSALAALVDNGMVKDISDLYSLDADEVAKLPVGNGVIGANADKIISEINKTRNLTIDRFIGSLSIKHLGRSRAALLVDKGFDNIDYYLNVNADNFVGMPCSETGVYGHDVAKEIYESLKMRKPVIQKLKNIIKIDSPKQVTTLDGKLSGMLFCFTGCRPNDMLKEAMEKEGAVIKSSVTKDLTHLVCKDQNSTSTKARKARDRGVEVIGLEDLEEMMAS